MLKEIKLLDNISLLAVGDICLGDSPKCLGFGVKKSIIEKGIDWPFYNLKNFINEDIVFGNLECVLSEFGLILNNFESEQMRGDKSFVKCLKNSNFNVINFANNHSMQHGIKPFIETVELLENNGISVVGLKDVNHYFSKPIIKEVKGCLVGFLGYSFENDLYNKSNKLLYASNIEYDQIIEDIIKIKDKVDWLVVSLHWGVEYMNYPSPSSVLIGRGIIDAGANIIIGHHPHVIQGIEKYRKGIICYSLGNFIFDMIWCKQSRQSMMVSFELKRSGDIDYKVIPIFIGDDFRPIISNFDNKYFEDINNKILFSKNSDYEKQNVIYYNQYKKKLIINSLRSNIYMMTRLFRTSSFSLIKCKILYFLNKFRFL